VTQTFSVSFDYLCPFARNAHEHVVAALRGGADWQVGFTPFSLAAAKLEDEEAAWSGEEPVSGVLALLVGLTVRDRWPERFLDVHEALFAARHDLGTDINDPQVLGARLDVLRFDGRDVVDTARNDGARKVLAREHRDAVERHEMWGVPTFVGAERAVFTRILDRPAGDGRRARTRIEQVLAVLDGAPELHELKQTDLPV